MAKGPLADLFNEFHSSIEDRKIGALTMIDDRASRFGGLSRAGKHYAPPLIAFAAARVVLHIGGINGEPPSSSADGWARWDSGLYLDLAKNGYTFFPCAEDPALACGNAGWMPGFPWIVRPLLAAGLPPALAGALVAAAFCLGFLTVIWIFWLREDCSVKGVGALVAVAVAPGTIYQHAVFPVSMLLCLVAIQGELVVRRRWGCAALVGAGAALTYATGFLVAVADVLGSPVRTDARRRLAGILGALGVGAGLGALFLIHRLQVGRWNAFFVTQAKYGHGLSSPLGTLASFLGLIASANPEARVVGIQILSTVVFVLLGLWGAIVSARTNGPASDRFAAVLMLAFFIVPLTLGTGVSPIRAEALLAPAGVLLRWLPRWIVALWLVAATWMAWATSAVFFAGHLV